MPCYVSLQGGPMSDPSGTRAEMIEEISRLKQRIQQLERSEAEHGRVEDALRESERRFRSLVEATSDWVWEINSDGFYTYASPKVEDLLGYKPEEVIGRAPFDLMPKDEAERVAALFKEIAESRQPFSGLRNLNLHKDGREVMLETNGVPIVDARGNFLGYRGFDRDITDQKQADNELRKSEERFKKAFYTSPDSININRLSDGMFISINKGFSDVTGYQEEEIVGKTSLDLNIWDDANDRAKLLEDLREIGKVENLEARFRTKSGEIKHGMMSATLIDLEGVPHIISITRDITQRKHSEEERARLESQLFQSQKMESIGTLAGGIAHDFNNILTVIIGFSSMLQMSMKEDDPQRAYIDQVLASSEKATGLTKSLLTFSRKQQITLKPLDINNTVKDTSLLLKRLLTEDIELKIDLSDKTSIVMGDVTQIDQILFNLTANARDAMPQGGTLTIETKVVELGDEFIKLHGYGECGKYTLLSVSDTGTGMDEATKAKIFDPFFTTKEMGKGTGLGLSTVYGIVKQHNGYATVYSERGRGTSFHIYLPRIDGEKEREARPLYDIKKGSGTILIGEDDPGIRMFARQILQRYGYTIVEARDGEEAISTFMENKNKIGLCILDVVMPRKNGKEVYNEIIGISPAMKFLFMSGYTGDIVLDKGIREDTVDFIAKPLFPDELLKKVSDVLGR
jgi:two-component system, cell cycle sensor histidine kinase and response regulator CckA